MATIALEASTTLQWCMSGGRRSNACLAHNLVVRLLELCWGYRYRQEIDFLSRIEMMVLPPGTAMISDSKPRAYQMSDGIHPAHRHLFAHHVLFCSAHEQASCLHEPG